MALKTIRVSIIGLGLAFLVVSCAKGSGTTSNCPSGQMEGRPCEPSEAERGAAE